LLEFEKAREKEIEKIKGIQKSERGVERGRR
jgi:hypothetical protein